MVHKLNNFKSAKRVQQIQSLQLFFAKITNVNLPWFKSQFSKVKAYYSHPA